MTKKITAVFLGIMLICTVFVPAAFAASSDTYDPDTAYSAGSVVVYNNISYTAKWYTRGDTPGGASSPWERTPVYDKNGVEIWYSGMTVSGGKRVSCNGSVYQAKYWTSTVPGSDSSWTLVSGSGTSEQGSGEAGGSGESSSETQAQGSGISKWTSSAVYNGGDKVSYNGITYTAKYYNVGETPSSSSAWARETSYDENGVAVYYENMVCTAGDKVSYNGSVYQARYWTNTVPGSDSSWTLISGSGSTVESTETAESTESTETASETEEGSAAEWNSSKIYYGKDKVLYNGIVYTAKYYNSGETPGTSSAWEREPEYIDGVIVWYSGLVCTQGDKVSYNGKIYEAKYWTDTVPGSDSSWKNLTDPEENTDESGNTQAKVSVYSDHTVDASLVSPGSSDFRTVGYFPFYSASWADNIDWDCLTHIIYAFAFPDGKGGLQPLDDTALVQKLITEGHSHGVKVMLGVGGWAYYGTIMEYQFDGCTATPELTDKFTDSIMALVDKYGFDGVDVDWEHPRAGSDSWQRYEAMMIQLRQKLGSDRLLTSAVLSGVTTDGTVYYDAAAHTANVMAVCDWFNVMAYDCSCTLEFCQNVARYWCETRGMPANKVCMGVPFYSYPGWSAYSTLIQNDPSAVTDDMSGTADYHNGVTTMAAKTKWAMKYGLGGMMIWELSQDSTDPANSLIRAIHNAVSTDNN